MIKLKEGFSFTGKMGRKDFAIWQIIILLCITAAALLVLFEPSQASSLTSFVHRANQAHYGGLSNISYQPNYIAVISKYVSGILLALTALYTSVVTMVKRIKDLGVETLTVVILTIMCLTASSVSLTAGFLIVGGLLILPKDILAKNVSPSIVTQ